MNLKKDDKQNGSFYVRVCQPMGQTVKTILLLRQAAERRIEPEFKEEFGGFSIYFYKDIFSEENLRKMGLNERQSKAVLYVKEKGKITNSEYQELNSISRQMSTIDLTDLVSKKVFIKMGKAGKGIAYHLTNN